MFVCAIALHALYRLLMVPVVVDVLCVYVRVLYVYDVCIYWGVIGTCMCVCVCVGVSVLVCVLCVCVCE